MRRVRHPIYSNSGEVKCSNRPKKGINIARHCVNGYSITAAPVKSVIHVSFWWCVYQAYSNGGEYATRPVSWATGSGYFSIRGYEVPSEPSEPSGTPGCVRRKLGLLLMCCLDLIHSIASSVMFLYWFCCKHHSRIYFLDCTKQSSLCWFGHHIIRSILTQCNVLHLIILLIVNKHPEILICTGIQLFCLTNHICLKCYWHPPINH